MNIGKGTVLKIKEPVFTGSFKNPKLAGERVWIGEVIKESYGCQKGQHTFTLKVLDFIEGVEPLEVGAKARRKGRTLYTNCVRILKEAAPEVLKEKVARGEAVRAARRRCIECHRVAISVETCPHCGGVMGDY